MADGSFVTWITGPAPPVWLAFFAYGVWWIRGIPDRKHRNTEADLADDQIVGAQWKRFQEEIMRLAARVEKLEQDVAECHEREARERAGRLEAEALLMAKGRAAQEAAGIVARERLQDKNGG